MDPTFSALLGFIFGGFLVGLVVWAVCRAKAAAATARSQMEAEAARVLSEERLSRIPELDERLRMAETQFEETRLAKDQLATQKAVLENELKTAGENNARQIQLLEEAREHLAAQFQVLANRIFEEKSTKFTEHNKERLGELLNPLTEKLREFEKTVRESYEKEGRERFSLKEQIQQLQEVNKKLDQEAVNLTNALKGQSKAQGNWGEMVLERVLEKSGLVRGREFDVQVALAGEEGNRLQPDVVVHLPEDKHLVIDAKVSLVAYERYCSAESDEERSHALKEHVNSIRQHVRDLSSKSYQSLGALKCPDFVLLFVPIEPSFAVAVQQDADLFTDAFQKNIVIVSPSTLWATLRTVAHIWRTEEQNRNTQEIARQAGRMHDRFVDFVADLEKIGVALKATEKHFESATKRLVSGKGNLIGRAEKIRQLGIRGTKDLPKALLNVSEDPDQSEAPDDEGQETPEDVRPQGGFET